MFVSVCLLIDLILGLCYSNLIWETRIGEFELASAITLVKANRLTKCANHPKS